MFKWHGPIDTIEYRYARLRYEARMLADSVEALLTQINPTQLPEGASQQYLAVQKRLEQVQQRCQINPKS